MREAATFIRLLLFSSQKQFSSLHHTINAALTVRTAESIREIMLHLERGFALPNYISAK